MTVYVWDSAATDVTGRNLATALRATEGREKPRAIAGDILIGWGAKIDREVAIPEGVKILNHPNAIRKNRNKFSALELMKANRELSSNIAPFFKAEAIIDAIDADTVKVPVIGRKNYHQGGEGFWLCLTKAQVSEAIAAGAQYFQAYIDIKDEFRLHVFGDTIIYAVKKVENATKEGWVAQRVEKVTDYAQKNNVNVNADTMNYVLGIIYGEQQLPDRVVRSNHRGWKFSSVRLNTLSEALKTAAIRAVKAIGLDFGAVDCCVDNAGHPYIIEVNSAPGLQGTTLEKYIETFQAKITEFQRPVQAAQAAPRANRVAGAARRAVAIDPADAVAADGVMNAAANAVGDIGRDQVRMLARNVRNDAEARRLLDLLFGE